jgi:[FeFe] hydrogenase H-cluster maturation GTPase HydF
MKETPKSLRLQIGILGRANVGKSSFLNMVSGQDVSITSEIPGTTTDVVEKTMELLPLGPVVFLDTAGINDSSVLAGKRIERSEKALTRADVVILVTEPNEWGEFEEGLVKKAAAHKTPVITVVNKSDVNTPSEDFLGILKEKTPGYMLCASVKKEKRDGYVNTLKKLLMEVAPDDFMSSPPLLGDLVPPNGLVVMIVPIDLEAPKGRLILPQVQAIRDSLDNDTAIMVVKESEYASALAKLKGMPDLVVCDSQVVDKMVAQTPAGVSCTTFSMLFARFKGDLVANARAAASIKYLMPGDRVLIAESCSHHAIEDDIGRVKIPKWIERYVGGKIKFDVSSGRDYPKDLADYKLVIQCGACMLTRRETLFRMSLAMGAGVPVTNYGVCISFTQGVLERVLSPFPEALSAYKEAVKKMETEYEFKS